MENKFTNIKERVVKIAEKQPIKKKYFFKSIKMTSANFRGNAKNTPLNSTTVANIIAEYPETDLYWLITGTPQKTSFSDINTSQEPDIEYHKQCKQCTQKEEMVEVLKKQIQYLKSDNEDLKKLLGLRNTSESE